MMARNEDSILDDLGSAGGSLGASVALLDRFSDYWGFEISPGIPFALLLDWHKSFHVALCNTLEIRSL